MISLRNFTFLAALALKVTASSASLPPGSIQSMKGEADEVLMISVDDVNHMTGQPPSCLVDVQVSAAVIGVNKTTLGFTPGDKVNFNSYYQQNGSSLCDGFVGPTAPPELFQGWCGYAYLDDTGSTSKDQTLDLAAYGDSLEIYLPYMFGPGPVVNPPSNGSEVSSSENQESNGGGRKMTLASGATEGLLKNADEVLLIKVESTENAVGQLDGCLVDYQVEAQVFDLNKTTLLYNPGETVYFKSYYKNEGSSLCDGFVGPTIPPKLEQGWCGYVYLDDDSVTNKNEPLELAAYGDSFQAVDADQCTTVSPPNRRLRGARS